MTRWSTFTSKPKPLKPFSAKREAQLDQYEETRRIVFERAGGRCEAEELLPSVCCRGPLECHHRHSRGRYPSRWLEPDACKALCEAHHHFVTEHPAEAERVGLLIASER